MVTLNNWYKVARCKWGHEGQQCEFTGGIYKQHADIVHDMLSGEHIELYIVYRSYYV